MRARRGRERVEELCSGPGKLTQALAIELAPQRRRPAPRAGHDLAAAAAASCRSRSRGGSGSPARSSCEWRYSRRRQPLRVAALSARRLRPAGAVAPPVGGRVTPPPVRGAGRRRGRRRRRRGRGRCGACRWRGRAGRRGPVACAVPPALVVPCRWPCRCRWSSLAVAGVVVPPVVCGAGADACPWLRRCSVLVGWWSSRLEPSCCWSRCCASRCG